MEKKQGKLKLEKLAEISNSPPRLTKRSRFGTRHTLEENMEPHSHKYLQALLQSKCQKGNKKEKKAKNSIRNLEVFGAHRMVDYRIEIYLQKKQCQECHTTMLKHLSFKKRSNLRSKQEDYMYLIVYMQKLLFQSK